MLSITQTIAQELNVHISQVTSAIQLLDAGDTVPFISRYRKEVTGGLTDTHLRTLEERLQYLRELEERRSAILKSIEEQGKLTPELKLDIENADSKARLEDLYLPYKPRRRTKAQIAKESGLEPLAQALLNDPNLLPSQAAEAYINPDLNVPDTKTALEGARFILMEQFSEDANLIGVLRNKLWNEAELQSQVAQGKEEKGEKYKDYFSYQEAIKNVPSHRALAILRGRHEEILHISLGYESPLYEQMVASHFKIQDLNRPGDAWMLETIRWTWRVKLFIQLELEFYTRLKEEAEIKAIQVFADNLRDLLMSAPAGSRTILGLDPGFRTGIKVAVVDITGKLLQHGTLYPHEPKKQWDESIAALALLCKTYKVDLLSIGNGTASRETDQLVSELIKKHPDLHLKKMIVSEAGASVYSASEFAAAEFPDLDVSIRGAVSIARRLQDPLAELVKIDPKAIGVGQYQHDVNQLRLAHSLNSVVEDCVNAVGVDVNTASIPLLTRVAGLNSSLAKNIIAFRDEKGAFKNRQELTKIPRLGAKTFEQAAGFLRIINGENPLDASAVHPEAYPVVNAILEKNKKSLKEIIGNKDFLKALNPSDYTNEQFGLPTVTDIIKELEKPGRDPRPEFKTATFNEQVQTLDDVKPGMILEGVVSNVANFGAFVDIGVHQDGLIHISALADRFIQNPRDIVKAGDLVKVKVLDVDIKRKRISLTLRLQDPIPLDSTVHPTSPPATSKQTVSSTRSVSHDSRVSGRSPSKINSNNFPGPGFVSKGTANGSTNSVMTANSKSNLKTSTTSPFGEALLEALKKK